MILDGQRGVSADTALRLGRYFGTTPQLWLNLQKTWELRRAEIVAGREIAEQVQKALRFYTETLGFQVKHNIPMGEHAWITVVSEEAPEGTEFTGEAAAGRHMMLRNILAAIVGYVAMAAVLFALFSLLWLTVGPSRAFEPGSWAVPGGWVLVQFVLGLVGAYIGGRVCAMVAHDARGATILIGVVLVLGVVNAVMSPEMAAGPRPDDLSMMEATAGAVQPAWFNWLNPLVGAVGVWLGSRKLRA